MALYLTSLADHKFSLATLQHHHVEIILSDMHSLYVHDYDNASYFLLVSLQCCQSNKLNSFAFLDLPFHSLVLNRLIIDVTLCASYCFRLLSVTLDFFSTVDMYSCCAAINSQHSGPLEIPVECNSLCFFRFLSPRYRLGA